MAVGALKSVLDSTFSAERLDAAVIMQGDKKYRKLTKEQLSALIAGASSAKDGKDGKDGKENKQDSGKDAKKGTK